MTTEEFAAAVKRRLSDLGQSQEWLGAEAARLQGRENPYDQSTVAYWLGARNGPEPPTTFAIERALQVRSGSLSRLLGYLPVSTRSAVSVPDAIKADLTLTDIGRRVLLAAYEQLVDHGSDGP